MTSLLMNDEVHINHINPYTATNTFGVSYNGGYKFGAPDISAEVGIDDTVMFPGGLEDKDTGVPMDHFNPLTIDRAGNRYIKTLSSANYAPAFMWPARKFQFDNGSTTFGREAPPINVENYVTPDDFGPSDSQVFKTLVIGTSALLVVLLAFQKS